MPCFYWQSREMAWLYGPLPMRIKNRVYSLSEKQTLLQFCVLISVFLPLSYGHQSAVDLCFLRKLFTSFFSRFPDSQIVACPAFSRILRNGLWSLLPAHSDRIVQDFHLIPYYPTDASMGTEKLNSEYNPVS